MIVEEKSWTCQYSKDKLLLLQQILWDMYVQISDIFDKNGIKYFLSYGSLLGALRHHGFIPWDDDFDICVMCDDYDRAIKILQNYLPIDKYVIHNKQSDSRYWLDYTKIRHLNSEVFCALWPDDNRLKYRGICLDIFRCWEESQSKFTNKYKQYQRATLWYRMQISQDGSICRKFQLVLGLGYNFSKLCSYWLLDAIASHKRVIVMDPESISKPFNAEWLFPLSTAKFNGRECPIPNNAVEILNKQYGNWRKFPPIEKRTSHFQSIEVWDNDYIKK